MNDSLFELFRSWNLGAYFYTTFLVFIRVGALISLMPGFGEQFLSPRIKLMISMTLAIALQPVIIGEFIAPPIMSVMLEHILTEFMVGVMFGTWVRMIYLSLSIAAGFCAQVLGITNIFDATLEPGGAPALSGFFSFTALAVLSATGGHYFIFQAFTKTYDLVGFTGSLDYETASLTVMEAGAVAIGLGLRIALPFLVVGFLINIGLGFVNRAMPQIPVFFVGQPIMLGVGFILLSLLLSSAMLNWTEVMKQFLLDKL